jgi:hypothetical protein
MENKYQSKIEEKKVEAKRIERLKFRSLVNKRRIRGNKVVKQNKTTIS